MTPAKTVEKPFSYLLGIFISSGLLLFLNIAAFILYRQSHCGEAFVVQLWTYLASDIFKVITVSLVFPTILLILDRKFKFGESSRKNLAELIEKKRLERKAKREEAISHTIKWWNELYVLATEVSRFKGGQPNQSVDDLIVKIYCISSTGEDVVNMWSHRFPELSDAERDSFIVFLNALIYSSHTVANAVADPSISQPDKDHLQNCLVVILDGIKGIAHHKIINVLNCVTNLDDPDPQHANDEKWRSALEYQRNYDMSFLTEWAKPIAELSFKENRLRDDITSDPGKKLDVLSNEFLDWLVDNPTKSAGAFPEFNELQKTFEEIPSADRARVQSSPHSRQYVIALANLAGFQNLQNEFINRAIQKRADLGK